MTSTCSATFSSMEVIEPVETMRNICERLRKAGKRIRLVPTMGSLHIGHGSLIKRAKLDTSYSKYQDVAIDGVLAAHPSASIQHQGAQQCDPVRYHHNSIVVSVGNHNDRDHDDNNDVCQPTAQGNNNNGNKQSTTVGTTSSIADTVVIVSIFVNPKQFNNKNDFINYPSTLEADLSVCRQLNVDYVFLPKFQQIYPDQETCTLKPPPRLGHVLEGKSRPGHFEGMLTIVCKLFNIIQPHEAYFGEKDYQQLILVTKMVRDLNLNVIIKPVPTVRDSDLLPLSSRNVRLNKMQRQVAPVMYEILKLTKESLEDKCKISNMSSAIFDLSSIAMASSLVTQCLHLDEQASKLVEVDYLELRCAKDLGSIKYNDDLDLFDCSEACVKWRIEKNLDEILVARLLISVIVGQVRLLDNVEVKLNQPNNDSKRNNI